MKKSLQTPALRRRMAVAVLPLLHAAAAWAGTSVWTGGAGLLGNKFSQSLNWANGRIPGEVPGTLDDLVLVGSSGHKKADNDLRTISQISSLRCAGGFISLSGQSFGVENFITAQQSGAEATTLDQNVAAVGPSGPTSFRAELGGFLILQGIHLQSAAIFHTESRADQPPEWQHTHITIHGPLVSEGAIFVEASQIGEISPNSTVTFLDTLEASTYTGPLRIRSGAKLDVLRSTCLGTTQSGTTVESGGRLRLLSEDPLTSGESFQLDGELRTGVRFLDRVTHPVTLTGPIVRNISGRWTLGSPLTLTGVLSGAGHHDVRGAGFTMRLAGTAANTFTGNFTTTANLMLDKPAGRAAVPGNLKASGGATVQWVQSNQVGDAATLTLNASTANLVSSQETVANLVMEGAGSLMDTGTLGTLRVNTGIICRNGAVARIAGTGVTTTNLLAGGTPTTVRVDSGCELNIDADTAAAVAGAGFLKTNAGTLRIEGAGTWSAPVRISDGLVVVDRLTTAPVTLEFSADNSKAILAGTGRVGTITGTGGGGMVAPGSVGNPGTLQCGSIALNAESALLADLEGTAAGTGHDQLIVTGSVNLGGADLLLDTKGFTATAGTSFILIANDGTDAITGTFAGLPQGALLPGGRFTISYSGGTGNDVVLVAVAQPSGVTRTWTGASTTSDFWNAAANWSPAGIPQNGDALVFPTSASRRTTNLNNLPALSVQSISITGGSYILDGNALAIAGGIAVSGSILLNHAIRMDLSLTGPQTISVGSHFLTLSGNLDTNGMPVTFHTPGTAGTASITCNGIISEGGGNQFTKTGGGRLVLGGNNTFGGNFNIAAGEVMLTHEKGLGSFAGHTSVAENARLTLDGTAAAFNVREPLFLNGTLQTADGAGSPNLVTYPITCGAAATVLVSATGVTRLNLNVPVLGGTLRKTGPGVLLLSGTSPNGLTGGITVTEGKMQVLGVPGNAKLSAAITVGTATTPAVLEIDEDDLVAPDSVLVVNPGSSVAFTSNTAGSSTVTAEFAGMDLRGGTLSGSRLVRLTGPLRVLASSATSVIATPVQLSAGTHVWTIENGTAAVDLQVTGRVEDEGVFPAPAIPTDLQKIGAGRVDFLSAQSARHPDMIRVLSGHCRWSGNSPDMAVEISGGTFSGTPVVGTVSGDGGILSPGASPGILTASRLEAPAVTMPFELAGSTPGTGYDQIRLTGTGNVCDLSRAALQITVPAPATFTPPPGMVFTLIDVPGTSAPAPFANLPEGSIVFGGAWDRRYRVSYTGGSGNDVTLTTLAAAPPPELSLSGVNVTIDPVTGTRTLTGNVSGGPGAAGLILTIETSSDLQRWGSNTSVTTNAAGTASFSFIFSPDRRAQFIRARFP